MDLELVARKFEGIGVRLLTEEIADHSPRTPHWLRARGVTLRSWTPPPPAGPAATFDVRTDRRGEYFLLRYHPRRVEDLRVIDFAPRRRHVVLQLHEKGARQKAKFLCGHDERHWFVAAIPPRPGVTTVETAMDALKPPAVQAAEVKARLKRGDRLRRRNAAFVRQGEWFFVPRPDLHVDPRMVLRDEPLARSLRSKAHRAEECVRLGGDTVYVSRRYPTGLTQAEYEDVLRNNPGARKWGWRVMRRGAEVYVRGRVRHSDHKMIVLKCWHRVLMNTENEAPNMEHVTFLD